MYKIYADYRLIYDSTIEDYKIGKGLVTLEINKSGSFVFSVYPDHFYYDKFVKMKTIITVLKNNKVVFRGRILNTVTDYWNNKVITCEGELGFLQDSIIRPFAFSGSAIDLFQQIINKHNSQVEYNKQFNIDTFTVFSPTGYIECNNSDYESSIGVINNQLIGSSPGGYIYITHDDFYSAGSKSTINYVSNFYTSSKQRIEFGSNLKNYTKTVKAENITTAIIPLGAKIDDGNKDTEDKRLTIADINGGVDYVYSTDGVNTYGWIFKIVEFDDVTDANLLKSKAEELLRNSLNQAVTIEINAIDLHLIDPTIASINIGEYVRATSAPHNFDETMLCSKQTMDLLKPENDTVTLGYTGTAFTESSTKTVASVRSTLKKSYTKGDTLKLGGADNSLGVIYGYDASGSLIFTLGNDGVSMASNYGSNGNGNYYKFPDGTLICTKRVGVSATLNVAWGSMYETSGAIGFGGWAHDFIDTPVVNISSRPPAGGHACFIEGLWDTTATSVGGAYLCRPVSTETTTYWLDIIGIGRWK